MKYSIRIIILSCTLIFCRVNLIAEKFNFKNYTVINGLGSSSVNHILQDSKGYLWFGTQGGGASMFNGRKFRNFTKADGLINNDVTCMAEDKAGNIWIGTASGASQWNGNNFNNYGAQEGLADEVVDCIYIDAENNIWFALRGSGVKIFKNGKFDSLTVKNGLPSNEVYSIARDNKRYYWFGLSNGIASYDGKQITSYGSLPNIKGKIFFSSLNDKNGNVWFGATSGGVIVIHADKTIERFELPIEVKNDFIGSMVQDRKGNIWFATDHGLLKYNGSSFKLFTEKEGLSVNAVQCVAVDDEDNIWCGTNSGGVNLLSSEAFAGYTDKDGLTSNNVTCICSDPLNHIYYVGTGNGLFVFNPAGAVKFRKVGEVKQVANSNITSLSMYKKGELWVCTQEGVFVLEKQSPSFRLKEKYTAIAKREIVSPLQIIHDVDGNVWMATYGSGLFFISGKEEKYYSTKNGFPSDKILTVFQDSHSNLWIGTQDAGVFKLNGKTIERFDKQTGFPAEAVWSIAEDETGNLFFGTGENGLCRYNGKGFTTFSTKDGICSDYILLLAWNTKEHCLWAGSDKGLNKLMFKLDGTIEQIRTYNEHDGFNSVGINQNAVFTDTADIVWFGAINGLWMFNRHNDFPLNTSPQIQLTGVRLAYQKVDWRKFTDSVDIRTNLPHNLKLSYKNNHLVFDIQALTTDDVSYSFKLEGYDEDWSPPSKNNEINYSNITPGKGYIFKAKAVNSKGISSAETMPFVFSILPPWWSTWWFRIMAFIFAFNAAVVFVKLREKVLKERNVKLEKTVVLRTHEIAQQKEIVERTLSEKEILLHEKEVLLKEIHHRVKNNLQTISSMLMLQSAGMKDEQSKKAIAESQSRVRSIALVHKKLYETDGLEKVEFNGFVKDLTTQITSVYREQSRNILVERNIPETYLLIDKAIPFGLILNELLTNSFKYAFAEKQEGTITMQLINADEEPLMIDNKSLKRKRVKFIYRDSGPGLKSEEDLQNASTLGLRLINLLSQQIGATLQYANTHGSEFMFTFVVNI